MEADRKAISVSGFIVRSLEPAKSKHQMSVREHSGVLSTPSHPHLLPKRPKISQLGEQSMLGIAEQGACSVEIENAASETGDRRTGGQEAGGFPALLDSWPQASDKWGLKRASLGMVGLKPYYLPSFVFTPVLCTLVTQRLGMREGGTPTRTKAPTPISFPTF